MPPTILYVEDNAENARLVERVVTALGHRLLHAANGETGVKMAEAENPDLILLDINLPDIDGYEVARRLRSGTHCRTTPIIAITANALKGDQERVLAAGCDYYTTKPINIRALRQQIEGILKAVVEDKPEAAAPDGGSA